MQLCLCQALEGGAAEGPDSFLAQVAAVRAERMTSRLGGEAWMHVAMLAWLASELQNFRELIVPTVGERLQHLQLRQRAKPTHACDCTSYLAAADMTSGSLACPHAWSAQSTVTVLELVDGTTTSWKAEGLSSPDASWERMVRLLHVVVLPCRSNLTVLSEVVVLKLLRHLVLLLSRRISRGPCPRREMTFLD